MLGNGMEALAAQAPANLRAHEAKYHSIINSIDVGFCIVEVAFDNQQRPIEYRFVEVNAAFERSSACGRPNASGCEC
jgi:carbamoylphosphate synthase large subunit